MTVQMYKLPLIYKYSIYILYAYLYFHRHTIYVMYKHQCISKQYHVYAIFH